MSDFTGWWHDRSIPGASVALDAALVERSEHGGRVLEVLDHERFGRLVALDGVLIHVEEDPTFCEMFVHVAAGGVEAAAPRVLVLGGDASAVSEALRRPDVSSVEVDAGDGDLFAAWARAIGLEASPRLRVAPDGDQVDLIVAPGGAPVPAHRLAAGGVVVFGDAVILEKRGARWRSPPGAPPAPVGLAPSGRWFAMSPTAAGGYYGFTAFAQSPVELAEPRRAFEGRHYNADLHRAAFALPAFFGSLS